MIKKLLPVVLVTLLGLTLVGIKVYPDIKALIASKKIEEATNKQKPNNLNGKHPVKEEKFPFRLPAEEEYAKKYPNQFKIVKKMYFSMNYIKNAEGEYEENHNDKDGISHMQFYTDFDQRKNRANFEKIINGKIVETIQVLLKDGIVLRQRPNKHIFTRQREEKNDNHFIGLFNNVTNSEWWALIYNNYPDWSYKEGKKFGMPVYKIKGNITDKVSESLQGPFTMVVSKETGALLDLKCYGHESKEILSITVRKIKINQGISNDVFHLDISGSKKISNMEFNISDIENYEEKTGGTDTSK